MSRLHASPTPIPDSPPWSDGEVGAYSSNLWYSVSGCEALCNGGGHIRVVITPAGRLRELVFVGIISIVIIIITKIRI
jgi:hypothetical protein